MPNSNRSFAPFGSSLQPWFLPFLARLPRNISTSSVPRSGSQFCIDDFNLISKIFVSSFFLPYTLCHQPERNQKSFINSDAGNPRSGSRFALFTCTVYHIALFGS